MKSNRSTFRISIPALTIVIAWPLLLPPYLTLSQTKPAVSFERFTTEQGLPSNSILDIAQDHQGYIWIATEDGLVRYNGYAFESYSHIPGDSSSLSQNRVETLFVDFKGDLWIGSKSDLDRYNPACNCFIRYAANPSAPSNNGAGQINAFAEDRNKNLWIGSQNGGLFRYERNSNQFTRFLNDPADSVNLLEDEVRVLLADQNHQLWIGTGEPFDASSTGGGLILMDLHTGKAKRYLNDPADSKSLIDNRISALFEDQDGKLWVGSCQSGLHCYEPENDSFLRMLPDAADLYAPQGEMGLWSSCPHVKFIHQDQNGEFWVGTYNGGLNHFNPVNKKLTPFFHNPGEPGSLSSNQVWSFLQDSQDRLWIGNLPGGLHKMDPSLNKFTIHTHNEENPASLSYDHVMGIYEAPGQSGIVWLGTQGGGLNRLDVKQNKYTHFRHDPIHPLSISSDIVWTTYEDSKGTFWVGTEGGLDTLNRQTGQFAPYKIKNGNESHRVNEPVISMLEDSKGRLWLGTWSSGIICLSKDRQTFKRYNFSNSSQQTFYNSVLAIKEGINGTIWAGIFQEGLFRYDNQSDSFSALPEKYGVTCMLEQNSENMWVGTPNNGLFLYNKSTGSIRQYTTEDGLSSNTINGILEDENGIYWLSTGNGIVSFDPETLNFTNFDASDGLSVHSFNHIGAFKSANGQMFFGGDGGLVSFYPEQIAGNPYPPDVVLSGLQVAGTSVDFQDKLNSPDNNLTLSHQQNDLTFDYVALHFTDPSKNLYKYKMENYDPEWIVAGTQRTARYTNLDPGQYTFQVIAGSSDGVWNETGTSLTFYITPPWWTRWWAYTLFAGILLVLARWFYKFKVSRKLAVAESRRLTEIDHFKSNLYTNITHEFRTPLTVILGLTDTLQSKAREQHWKEASQPLEMIERNGKNLLQLVNEMLDLAKLESGHLEMELQQLDVVPYIKYISEGFQTLARDKQIDLSLDIPCEQLLMDVDPAKLAAIVSNLLSNAIKFTPKGGKICIQLNQENLNSKEYFTLKVKDNGKGISQQEIPHIFDRFYQADYSSTRNTEGTGIGLALTKELVELMNGTIDLTSTPGMGSTFMVRIPITLHAPRGEHHEPYYFLVPALPKTSADSNKNDFVKDLPLVLFIEDNLDVGNYLKIILENKYQCLQATNGEAGLKMAFESIPDIIICDVMMPGMDGFEVCARLKTDKRSDHIPIIMLTAKAEKEARLTGLSRGADAYLSKPFDTEELMIRLEKLLETRKRLQEKYSRRFLSGKDQPYPIKNTIESFLVNAEQAILNHLEEEDFSVDQLADAICLSRSQVHRKIKALTGHSTSIYIRLIRLQKAKELLASGELNISEVAYRVGFKSPVYFSQIFRKTFGESPTESRH
ncbi:hybrid sensor histidine kinase/response regulator transcription factor [Cyclobacterium plantarum]|uniref:histidine kinase n=1 Tax=Cyclobacterium plantarum TaxID=2716263 RepID=A0ABX0HAL8_9BACT|nr:hybrid sensor histidine kinase/response regulator transcription factor [Cyclobacterium plantarum]NHE58734.1 response regulator [Cyclobacterium plantarum]